MKVKRIFTEVSTPSGNQAIAELKNGKFAVGQLTVDTLVPEESHIDDMELAFDKWYELINEYL